MSTVDLKVDGYDARSAIRDPRLLRYPAPGTRHPVPDEASHQVNPLLRATVTM